MLTLLSKFKTLFDGTLGDWKTEPVDLILKDPKTVPVYQKPYPVPKSKEKKLKEECQRLVDMKILRKINKSELHYARSTLRLFWLEGSLFASVKLSYRCSQP